MTRPGTVEAAERPESVCVRLHTKMLEKMINCQEIKNPEKLSDSYQRVSKWHFDFKDQ